MLTKQQVNHMSQLMRGVYSLLAHTVVPDVLGNIVVDSGWQSQVEETVCLGSSRQ